MATGKALSPFEQILCRRVLQGPPTEPSMPISRALKDAPTAEWFSRGGWVENPKSKVNAWRANENMEELK